ncbi:hypothetical protein Y032_0100g3296 [Ancylostoma ceylanicum]|uniref:Uncharacterized protein n=1 Tax=Ancylostoma ceylanicum TaxID=53326 RepID=A0A016THH0_9BILA|nr:hypothetical protein Y032_0100g3296 [Ancylostoma ceylanicum]
MVSFSLSRIIIATSLVDPKEQEIYHCAETHLTERLCTPYINLHSTEPLVTLKGATQPPKNLEAPPIRLSHHNCLCFSDTVLEFTGWMNDAL